jgi:hypothetical protein
MDACCEPSGQVLMVALAMATISDLFALHSVRTITSLFVIRFGAVVGNVSNIIQTHKVPFLDVVFSKQQPARSFHSPFLWSSGVAPDR